VSCHHAGGHAHLVVIVVFVGVVATAAVIVVVSTVLLWQWPHTSPCHRCRCCVVPSHTLLSLPWYAWTCLPCPHLIVDGHQSNTACHGSRVGQDPQLGQGDVSAAASARSMAHSRPLQYGVNRRMNLVVIHSECHHCCHGCRVVSVMPVATYIPLSSLLLSWLSPLLLSLSSSACPHPIVDRHRSIAVCHGSRAGRSAVRLQSLCNLGL